MVVIVILLQALLTLRAAEVVTGLIGLTLGDQTTTLLPGGQQTAIRAKVVAC